MTDDSLSR
jgi:hypothetical protein